MTPSFYPPQIGFLPTGTADGVQVSSVFIGRSSGSYEGIGYGQGGRPDYASFVQINLTNRVGAPGATQVITQYGSITLNVADLITAKAANTQVPTNLNLILKEVAVCESGVNRRMMVIASQTYATGAN